MLYSTDKGAPLTPQEIDGNFQKIWQRLEQLTQMDQVTLGTLSIAMEGDLLVLKTLDQRVIGQGIVPTIMPNFRGTWKENVSYQPQDWITHQGSLYVCIKPSCQETFLTEHWQSVSENPSSKE